VRGLKEEGKRKKDVKNRGCEPDPSLEEGRISQKIRGRWKDKRGGGGVVKRGVEG